jgi:hypothetical protein
VSRVTGSAPGISLANATTITEQKVYVIKDAILIGVSMNLANTGVGPVHVAASLILWQGGPAIRLFSKFIRAVISGEDDGAAWHGRLRTGGGESVSYISANLRNDSGSSVTVNVNWVAELDT